VPPISSPIAPRFAAISRGCLVPVAVSNGSRRTSFSRSVSGKIPESPRLLSGARAGFQPLPICWRVCAGCWGGGGWGRGGLRGLGDYDFGGSLGFSAVDHWGLGFKQRPSFRVLRGADCWDC
jgi:hypothetical protein